MIYASVGTSHGGDSYTTGADACHGAQNRFGSNAPDAAVVFASTKYHQEQVLSGIRSVIGNVPLVGSSTVGEISDFGSAINPTVVVLLLRSDSVKFHTGIGEGISPSSVEAGKMLYKQICSPHSENVKGLLIFADLLGGSGTDLLRGVQTIQQSSFVVAGGASGDMCCSAQTRQYLHDTVYYSSAVGLGLEGDLRVGVGVKHGWKPLGLPRTISKVEGSVIYEVEGKPAVSVYEDYFATAKEEWIKEQTLFRDLALMYPLGIRRDNEGPEILLRHPRSIGEDGSLHFGGAMPEGVEVQLMIGGREEMIESASSAARQALLPLESKEPNVAFVFSSYARRVVLGDLASEEIMAIQRVVGTQTPLIGFYTYGEFASKNAAFGVGKMGAEFHNGSIVVCTLSG